MQSNIQRLYPVPDHYVQAGNDGIKARYPDLAPVCQTMNKSSGGLGDSIRGQIRNWPMVDDEGIPLWGYFNTNDGLIYDYKTKKSDKIIISEKLLDLNINYLISRSPYPEYCIFFQDEEEHEVEVQEFVEEELAQMLALAKKHGYRLISVEQLNGGH